MNIPDATWNPVSESDLMIESLLPGRALRIRFIATIPEYDCVRLRYEMIPAADPPLPPGAPRAALELWALRNYWWVTARDPLGTAYETVGGAWGPSRRGDVTEGEDLRPAPPTEAPWLDLAFRAGEAARSVDDAAYTVRVYLPLPPLTIEDYPRVQRRIRPGW